MTCFGLLLPRKLLRLLLIGTLFGLAAPASAEMVLSQVIVDFAPNAQPHQDIEVGNSGAERIYVVAEPSEIVSAGKAEQQRVQIPDPQKLGLLVTPNRLILEPGERKLIRVAAIADRTDEERIYRIAVKPVVGDITASGSGLKILVGYDVLVIFRPLTPRSAITAQRGPDTLTLRNEAIPTSSCLMESNATPPARIARACLRKDFMPARAGSSRSPAARKSLIRSRPVKRWRPRPFRSLTWPGTLSYFRMMG